MQRSPNPIAAFVRQPLTIAVLAALVITGVLSMVVLGLWSGSGRSEPAVVQLAAPTPTPRAVRRAAASSPTAVASASPEDPLVDPLAPRDADIAISAAPSVTPEPKSNFSTEASDNADAPTSSPPPTSMPAPTTSPAPIRTPEPTRTPAAPSTPAPETLFAAATGEEMAAIAYGRWQADGGTLVISQPPLVAEPWLTLPTTVNQGPVTIRARVRVTALASGVCNQSFGLVIDRNGMARGGGQFFPCDASEPIVRVTDVTNWTDGYDLDRTLASAPGRESAEWQQLEMTLAGDELTLSIDGEEVVRATDPALSEPGDTYTFGLWSQGVQLEIQRIVVAGV